MTPARSRRWPRRAGAGATRPAGGADRPPGGREAATGAGVGQGALRGGSAGKTARALGDDLRERGARERVEQVTDAAVAELAPQIGVRAACDAVGTAQAGYYRRHRQSPPPERPAPVPHRDRPQPRALAQSEQQAILDVLHSERFVDLAPAEVWATLLDEGVYLGSISTFYRLLRRADETGERRRQATHPATVKPELVATAPNQVWSWDITKLRGPAKWTYYHLYVILDIFSRYVVGWMVASRESASLAEVLDPPDLRQAGHRPRPADHPRRPRLLDDLQAGGVPARRPRRHPVTQPPARLRRQPVQRGPVQDR